MTKVYGYSDDILCFEYENGSADEIGCYDEIVIASFTDGTKIRAKYGKENKGIWSIEVIKKGTAKQKLTLCNDENADIYSDVLEIEAEYKSHKFE